MRDAVGHERWRAGARTGSAIPPRTGRRYTSAGLVVLILGGCASNSDPGTPDPWEADIAAFEADDRRQTPAPGSVVFVGSSSIRLWSTLEADFPGTPVVNRGFGGSELSDALRFADRIIIPYRPRMVVVYAGDNDLWNGKSPDRVFEDFRALVRTIRAELPQARVAFIAVKPSLARWRIEREIRAANELVRQFAEADSKVDYIDIFTPMLGEDGRPRPELFVQDGLHLSARGYEVWTSVVAPFLRPDRARTPARRRPLLAGR